jgi:hypothetical protein
MFHFSPQPELHPIFETLGYGLGFGAYKAARRQAGDVLQERQRWSVIAAAMFLKPIYEIAMPSISEACLHRSPLSCANMNCWRYTSNAS